MDVGDDMMLLLFLMLLAAKLSCVITVLASNYLHICMHLARQEQEHRLNDWCSEFWRVAGRRFISFFEGFSTSVTFSSEKCQKGFAVALTILQATMCKGRKLLAESHLCVRPLFSQHFRANFALFKRLHITSTLSIACMLVLMFSYTHNSRRQHTQ